MMRSAIHRALHRPIGAWKNRNAGYFAIRMPSTAAMLSGSVRAAKFGLRSITQPTL